MGICNVTPNSFSDAGLHLEPARAREHIDALICEGADVVDIGGESTRPGAPPVPAAEQLERVLPAIRYAAERVCVSIDTTSAEVARAAVEAGASVVNDVSLLADEGLADVAAASGAVLVLSHVRGRQDAMRGFSVQPEDTYDDVVKDVLADWEAAATRARCRGVERAQLVMDPGLGFTKSARHSLALLRRTRELVGALDVPVLVGASRKSFLKVVDESAGPTERLGASIAASLFAARAGAAIVRVHDVRATRQALDLARAMGGP
jgi:dihydropteroate synthase